MLRTAGRSTATVYNGYICLSCRCQLSSSREIQVRSQSNTAVTTSNESWFDTINQISDEFPSKKPSLKSEAGLISHRTAESAKKRKKSSTGDSRGEEPRAARERQQRDGQDSYTAVSYDGVSLKYAMTNGNGFKRKSRTKLTPAMRMTRRDAISSRQSRSPTAVDDIKLPTKKLLSGHDTAQSSWPTPPSSRPLTVAEKVREAQERAKWGGENPPRSLSGSARARVSYDSLRKADKVSPEDVIETAVNAMPYGFKTGRNEGIQSGAQRDHGDKASLEHREGDATSEKPNVIPGQLESTQPLSKRQRQNARRRAKARSSAEASSQSPATLDSSDKGSSSLDASVNGSSQPFSEDTSSMQHKSKDGTSHNPSVEDTITTKLDDAQNGVSRKGQPSKKRRPRRIQSDPDEMDQKGQLRRIAPDTDDINSEVDVIEAGALQVQPLNITQPAVPYLEYGLDRVLFSPGVHQLQDPTSRVYNFDPYLQKIMPVMEFDFDSLKEYKTSSQDRALADLAQRHGKRYIGSTSSMTGVLTHFHYLLSSFRPINFEMLSKGFDPQGGTSPKFTLLNRAPSAIFLRWKNGSYAIDADKEFDTGNILMLLGKSMELLLTLPKSDYERYRKSNPRQVSEESKSAPESFQYTTMGDFLMRSQLDAYDPRLPGNGTFDLKTRAVVSVRMDTQDFEPMTGYELYSLQGRWGSYEREYYDMMRSTMLKYMLQARMGRMNGIFLAYHNIKRIFGFQYVPIADMDRALHGQTNPVLGDQEFKLSLELLNKLLNKATAKYPEQSLRIHFETRQAGGVSNPLTSLHMFAEPMEDAEIDRIQNSQKARIREFEDSIMNVDRSAEASNPKMSQDDTPPATSGAEDQIADQEVNLQDAQPSPDSNFSVPDAIDNLLQSLESTSSEKVTSSPVTQSSNDEELQPLFCASVIVKSRVNGDYVKDDRPENLGEKDAWSVEYLLQEYEVGRREWAAYSDMKARRRRALFDKEDADHGDAESGGRDKTGDYYLNFLRSMATKGHKLRERIDKVEAGKAPVVVSDPLPLTREKISGVDDYLKALYESNTT